MLSFISANGIVLWDHKYICGWERFGFLSTLETESLGTLTILDDMIFL